MSRTTDSVLSLARTALEVGRETFDAYSHPNSPKKFTQPQLFAMLVLRQQWGTGYAATATRLGEWPRLCQTLGLRISPMARRSTMRRGGC